MWPHRRHPTGSPVPGILQARTLEWVAISFSKAWKWKVKVKSLSCVRLLATPWTAPYQAPPSMGFSRQEYWSGVPLPSPQRNAAAAAAAKFLQSCPTLCDPIDDSPPWDSPGKISGVGCHFLLQCMKVKSEMKLLSHARLLATPWTAAYQAPPSMGFSRQEY